MSYSSNLKDWGAIGSEYPDGYSYVEGEPPVDEYDNFIMYNLIEDVQHAINELNNTDVSGDIESHRVNEVHELAQPAQDHGNEAHTETFATASELYTDEQAQDAVGGILSNEFIYDDTNNSISLDSSVTNSYTDENAQDAVANALRGGGDTIVNYYDDINEIEIQSNRYTDEEAEDVIAGALVGSGNVSIQYSDNTGEITIESLIDPGYPQDVTANRNWNTWYQNTTGNPLKVSIVHSTGTDASYYVNSSETRDTALGSALYDSDGSGTGDNHINFEFIVPDDGYYQLYDGQADSTWDTDSWIEQEL